MRDARGFTDLKWRTPDDISMKMGFVLHRCYWGEDQEKGINFIGPGVADCFSRKETGKARKEFVGYSYSTR